MNRLRLYGQVCVMGMQNALIYRWAFLLRSLVSLVPLLGTYFLWKAIFQNTAEVAGYTFASVMTYYLALMVLDAVASPTDDEFQIARDIKDGQLSQMLLKPVNYFLFRLSLFASSRVIFAAIVLLPLTIVLWWVWSKLEIAGSGGNPWLIAGAVLGSAALQFLIAYACAMMAFWFLEISGIIFLLYAGEFLAGGHMFPLDLLPKPLYEVAMMTPFPYEYYFPVAVACGRLQGAAVWQGFIWQWAWVAVLWLISQGLWRAGLKHYTSVGG